MRNFVLSIVILLVMSQTTAFAQADEEFQYWNTEIFEGKLTDKDKLKGEFEFRFNKDGLAYQHADIGVTHAFSKRISVGLNYRQIFERKGLVYRQENRPHVNFTYTLPTKYIQFEDRSRLEYRRREANLPNWRYRNYLSATFPKVGPIEPFLADEIFIDLNTGKMSRNRFWVGGKGKFNKKVGLELFYMRQSNRVPTTWNEINVLGSKLKFTL